VPFFSDRGALEAAGPPRNTVVGSFANNGDKAIVSTAQARRIEIPQID
jgi:hypothetical protein